MNKSVGQSEKFKAPPGTVYLNDSVYIDNTLITNQMYFEFLNNIKSFWLPKKSDSIRKLTKVNFDKEKLTKRVMTLDEVIQFDLLRLFSGIDNENSDFFFEMFINTEFKIDNVIDSKTYLVHPEYSKYPILYINKKQAEMFCKWRTDMVILRYRTQYKQKEERAKYYKKINYRLASYDELKFADSIFKNHKKVIKTKEKSPLKLKPKLTDKKMIFYNISEITFDDKIYGDNWKNNYDDKLPNNYTGFRCICEVEK